MAGGEPLPRGLWNVDAQTVYQLPKDVATAWIVIKLETPSEKGERSFVVQAFAKCSDKTLSVQRWRTTGDRNGLGPDIATYVPPAPVAVTAPAETVSAAIEQICEQARREASARAEPQSTSILESPAAPLAEPRIRLTTDPPESLGPPNRPRTGKGAGQGALDGLAFCANILEAVRYSSSGGPGPIELIAIVLFIVCTPFGVVIGALDGAFN